MSTIGELNAIATLTMRLSEDYPGLRLVLISDHEHYRTPYLTRHRDAVFFCTRGETRHARQLAARFPPVLLIVGEIPCLPSDAPCRFSYAFLREARKSGAVIALVNGWLYGYSPACRMESLERSLLTRDYLDAMDMLCVQTEEVKAALLREGADPDKIRVTGNMKFDGLARTSCDPAATQSPRILSRLTDGSRPVIVVGCIRKPAEQTMVVEAFESILDAIPDALMVFAHRHPEIARNIEVLEGELDAHGIRHDRRSRIGDQPPADDMDCLILDTMGELKDFYAAATIAHVGVDHNLLEPLSFLKPVTTAPNWEKGFPNYAIFQTLGAIGAVTTAQTHAALSERWLTWLQQPEALASIHASLAGSLADCAGATDLTMQGIAAVLPRV